MLILLSTPGDYPNEAVLVNRMLEEFPALLVHLRKPGLDSSRVEVILKEIDSAFHSRIVFHQHYELADAYSVKGIHLTATARSETTYGGTALSTSFHSLEEARKQESRFTYFFCSPIFPSISKAGYSGTENWDISGESTEFRKKAVALGGIETSRLESARRLGFVNFAVLGAVWQSPDPETALRELYRMLL